jgi:hypothetical protein
VRRVVFIAVPHRGSAFAKNIAGWIGNALTSVPKPFVELYARLDQADPDALQPAFQQTLPRGRLTSIGTLSPNHPMLPRLNALPFASWVQCHSIIGDRGRNGGREEGSDGVVPYTSSHLDGVASELIVPANHSAFRHPAALREIRRILALP